MKEQDENKLEIKAKPSGSALNGLLCDDRGEIANKFTEIVGRGIFYSEYVKNVDVSKCTAHEIRSMHDGWIDKYRTDVCFNHLVKKCVSQLIQVLDT